MFVDSPLHLRNRLKTISSCLGILFLCLLLPHQAIAKKKRVVLERIIAVVNNEIILLSEFRERFRLLKISLTQITDKAERAKRTKVLRKVLLEKMIGEKLLMQKAGTLRLAVTDKEIDSAINEIYQRSKRGGRDMTIDDFYKMVEQSSGLNKNSYRKMVRRELRTLKVLQTALRDRIRITEAQIRQEYEKTVKEAKKLDPTSGSKKKKGPSVEYNLSYIVVELPKDGNKEKTAVQRKKAATALKLALADSKNFAQIAKKYSEDVLAEDGGKIPAAVAHESISQKTWQKALLKMKAGQVHPKVLEEKKKLYVLFLEKKKSFKNENDLLDYAKVRGRIAKGLRDQMFRRERARFIKGLRRKAVIEVRWKP